MPCWPSPHQGDPLAFGLDRLRAARLANLAELKALEAELPPDRSRQLARAQVDLARRSEQLAFARKEAAAVPRQLDAAGQRRSGRRDRTAVAKAERQAAFTTKRVEQAEEVSARGQANGAPE